MSITNRLNKIEEAFLLKYIQFPEDTLSKYLFCNSLYTVNLLKKMIEIDENNKKHFYLHKIIHQDEDYIKSIYPYNHLDENNYTITDDTEYYEKLSYCCITVKHIINSYTNKWKYVNIFMNKDIDSDVIRYIFESKIHHTYNSIIIRYNFSNRNMQFIDYTFIKNNCKYILDKFLSTAIGITKEIVDENMEYIVDMCSNEKIDLYLLIDKISKMDDIILYNDCLHQLVKRKDMTVEIFDKIYIYKKHLSQYNFQFLYSSLLTNSRYIKVEHLLRLSSNHPSIFIEFTCRIVSNLSLDLTKYLEDKIYHDKLINIYGIELYTFNIIDKDNLIRLLKNNNIYEEFCSNEKLLVKLYLNNKCISVKFIKDNFNVDISNYVDIINYLDENNIKYYKDAYNDKLRQIHREIHKEIHKRKFKYEINEELIVKACSPKRMYNWNEYACEEFPDEYNKEYERYRIM